jgi:hypothetical protein
MTAHVERPTHMKGGQTYCACGSPWPCQERRSQQVELIRQQIGCTCEAHYSIGQTSTCERWRQQTAEKIVDALAAADHGSGGDA